MATENPENDPSLVSLLTATSKANRTCKYLRNKHWTIVMTKMKTASASRIPDLSEHTDPLSA